MTEIITNPNAGNEIRTRILSGSKFSVISRIFFQSISKQPIGCEIAKDHQKKLGFDPIAYDFEGFRCEIDPASKVYVADWYCYGSTGD